MLTSVYIPQLDQYGHIAKIDGDAAYVLLDGGGAAMMPMSLLEEMDCDATGKQKSAEVI